MIGECELLHLGEWYRILEPMVLHSKLKEKRNAIVNNLVPDLEIGDKLMIMNMLGQYVLMIASIITQNLEDGLGV